jgi:hypothetical protein
LLLSLFSYCPTLFRSSLNQRFKFEPSPSEKCLGEGFSSEFFASEVSYRKLLSAIFSTFAMRAAAKDG